MDQFAFIPNLKFGKKISFCASFSACAEGIGHGWSPDEDLGSIHEDLRLFKVSSFQLTNC